ncbi:hypothetical protein EDF83_2448 [Pseudomonas protegens]|nr:hypothetical protein EDF83_2448 [Pseudomonas protegens]ROQ86018.1 hypothetical protein EC837_2930 [Pseudomonas protegens]
MHHIYEQNAIAFAFKAVGGIGVAAQICGRSSQALSKWRQSGRWPRTEYTGETQYAELLASAAFKQGVPLESGWLLTAGIPIKPAAK